MFIAIQAGDILITATECQSLDKNDPMQTHYMLLFRDLPSGATAELSCKSETEQSYMVAAWIASDEEYIGTLQPYLDKLRERLPKRDGRHIFLP